jgi:hypothetical protein
MNNNKLKLWLRLRLDPHKLRLTWTVAISLFYKFYLMSVGIFFGNCEIIWGYLPNRFVWLKLWLLLRMVKFEVLSSYIIVIKLARALFR